MALISIHTNPTRRQLGVFGLTWLAVFGLLGWAVWARGGSLPAACAVWIAAAAVPAIGWRVPALLRIVYVGTAFAAWPIGVVLSLVLLAAVYYLLLTPIGLLMRLSGRDPMKRGFPSQEKSHWLPRRPPSGVQRYFHQF